MITMFPCVFLLRSRVILLDSVRFFSVSLFIRGFNLF